MTMVLIQSIVNNNCRLCHNKPGQYDIVTDKKLVKEIYECIKIRVNDKAMTLLPKCICEECKMTVKNFFLYKQHVRKVDQSLRKILQSSDLKCKSSESCCADNKLECSKHLLTVDDKNVLKSHIKSKKCNFDDNKKCFTTYPSESDKFQESYKCEKDIDHLISDQTSEFVVPSVKSDPDPPAFQNESKPLILKQDVKEIEEQINCDLCEQVFNSTDDYKKHRRTHKAGFVCSWKNCKKILTSAYTLKTHELKHAGKRSFLCVTCGKGFITKNSLTCHEKIHLDVKSYICKLCNIGFSVRSNLRAHEKKHHEGVRFYCSQCTKAFISKCSLERHERIHTGIKEFQCESCPSAFYTNKELVKHQRYHQGLRLHKCNECFKTFFERHHLVIHLRSHTGERPYVCKVPNCGKSFMESQKLKRHHKAKHAQL